MLSSSPPFGVLISPVIPIASIREQLTATQWSPQFLSAVQGASAARGEEVIADPLMPPTMTPPPTEAATTRTRPT